MRGEFPSGKGAFLHYLRAVFVCLVPWALIELLVLAQKFSFLLYASNEPYFPELWVWCVRVLLSAALTPFVFWVGARWPIERLSLSHVSVHGVAAICFALLRSVLEIALFYPLLLAGYNALDLPLENVEAALWNVMVYGFFSAFVRYWLFLSLQAAFRYSEKFRERERAAARLELHATELNAMVTRARLDALRMQLQPHFLFNTLNAIVVLVREGEQLQAEQALTRLSDLLRAVLDDREVQHVPLWRELEYLRLYLSIEQMRFSDRLEVSIEADPDLLEAAVPQMVLQPVVENAVRHGISGLVEKGRIDIRVFSQDDAMHFVVKDNGVGFVSQAATKGAGVGLSNLRARLQQLYGESAHLTIESNAARGTTVTLVLPECAAPRRDTAMSPAYA
ncbi:MAG TPA: histidine kinase [Steroidobacteraceae bacterium]|nr:histidine kinase [Steroidobacteraceae bacterium]